MLINEHTGKSLQACSVDGHLLSTAVYTDKIALVPYSRHHVTVYHDWMKDPDIQAATASEPLTLHEEYSMQQSWRIDSDKLTFILCKVIPEAKHPLEHVAEIASMIGDVNMFITMHEEDDGHASLVGEIELMIARKDDQGKGSGRSALLSFLCYIAHHEEEIITSFQKHNPTDHKVLQFDYLAAKINEQNGRSVSLFEKTGFKKTSAVPNFFGELELRFYGLSVASVGEMLAKHGISDYYESNYEASDSGGL